MMQNFQRLKVSAAGVYRVPDLVRFDQVQITGSRSGPFVAGPY